MKIRYLIFTIIILAVILATKVVLDSNNNNVASDKKNQSLASPIQASFFEANMTQTFSEDDWEEEIAEWKEMGIKYIILSSTAYKNPDGWYAYYPSKIAGTTMYYDAVGTTLKYCKEANIKVIIPVANNPCGANLCKYDKDCFNKQGRETFLKSIEETLPFIQDIYNTYYKQYKDIWYGWYFPPEVSNNIDWENPEYFNIGVKTLSESLNMTIEKIRALNPNFKIMLSPYLNVEEGVSYCTRDENVISNYYKEVINNTNFVEGDILAPQDSAKNMQWNEEKLAKYTKAYRKAVDSANKKIQLWSNLETFIYDDNYVKNADKIDFAQSTYLKTLLKQINAEKPYVDNFMSCSFCYYYTKPNSIDGFYNSYRDYLKNNTIDYIEPALPTEIIASTITIDGKDCLNIEFEGMSDNYGIARANIYKNGKMYCYRVSTRKGAKLLNKDISKRYPNEFFDVEFNLRSDTAKYEIELIDCTGNVTSSKFSFIVTSNNGKIDVKY